MAKQIEGKIKLQVPANQARPAPPIGPALGQRGLNISEFCKVFNARTEGMEAGIPLPTIVTFYKDKSFTLEIKTAPASFYLRRAAGLDKGSETPGRETVGSVTAEQVREIAELKMKDLNTSDVDAAMNIVLGSARSMGIEIRK